METGTVKFSVCFIGNSMVDQSLPGILAVLRLLRGHGLGLGLGIRLGQLYI